MTTDHAAGDGERAARVHFRKVSDIYQESFGREDVADIHDRIKRVIEPDLRGLVVDIGSAGVPDFESNPSRTVLSVDYTLESLRCAPPKNVIPLAGDIRAIPLRSDVGDRVIVQYVLHYLTSSPSEPFEANVRRALKESARVLRRGGKVFLVDSFACPAFELLQRALYPLSYRALRAAAKPTLFFFSVARLMRLAEACGLTPEKFVAIPWGRMSVASQTLFPRLRFPLRFSPVRCGVLIAVKR